MKTCTKCYIKKEENKFEKWRSVCFSCRNQTRSLYPLVRREVSVKEKICTSCNQNKLSKDFNKDSRRVDGLHPYCKQCRSKRNDKHYSKNREKKIKQSHEYYQTVRKTEKINKPARERQKRKESTDLFFKLKRRLRNRLYYALKNTEWKKDTNFTKYIGCDRNVLISHIESQFTEGMSWDNYGKWHIDHIKPLASATTEQELYSLCHYTNLQPMWSLENIKKADNI